MLSNIWSYIVSCIKYYPIPNEQLDQNLSAYKNSTKIEISMKLVHPAQIIKKYSNEIQKTQ